MGKLILDCLLLKQSAFEHVEEYSNFTLYSAAIVRITAICLAVGAIPLVGGFDAVSIIFALLKWGILAGITYALGVTILKTPKTHATIGQVARTLGFAQLPGAFYLLGLINPLFVLGVFIWQSWASVLAIRSALDYERKLRALLVWMIGVIMTAVLLTTLRDILGI